MKNYELLDMLGEVNEDCVQAADSDAPPPRLRWRAWAACAACAALIAAAYPAFGPVPPQNAASYSETSDEALSPEGAPEETQGPALHSYIVMEGGDGPLADQHSGRVPAGGPYADPAPEATMFSGAYISCAPACDEQGGEESAPDADGASRDEPASDASVQERAAAQYDNFWNNLGLSCAEADGGYPEWCGGVWIDGSNPPEARLVVAVVDGFRTPELEAQIADGCGGGVAFQDVKYSGSHLHRLMTSVGGVLDSMAPGGACFGFGVDVMENRLTVDVYGGDVSNDVLAELARLDPDGDAILVRLFPGAAAAVEELPQAKSAVIYGAKD